MLSTMVTVLKSGYLLSTVPLETPVSGNQQGVNMSEDEIVVETEEGTPPDPDAEGLIPVVPADAEGEDEDGE